MGSKHAVFNDSDVAQASVETSRGPSIPVLVPYVEPWGVANDLLESWKRLQLGPVLPHDSANVRRSAAAPARFGKRVHVSGIEALEALTAVCVNVLGCHFTIRLSESRIPPPMTDQ